MLQTCGPSKLELGSHSAEMQNWGIPAFGKGNTQPPPAYGKASPELAQASGPYGDKAKPELKPGDWICPQCGDHQFARNWFCKMCARSGGGNDPMAAMMAMMMAGGFSGGKGNQVKGDPQFLVYVANIDWKALDLSFLWCFLSLVCMKLVPEIARHNGKT